MTNDSATHNVIVYGFKYQNITLLAHILSIAYARTNYDCKIKEFSSDTRASVELFHLRVGKACHSHSIPHHMCDTLIAFEWVGLYKIIEEQLAHTSKIFLSDKPTLDFNYYYQYPTRTIRKDERTHFLQNISKYSVSSFSLVPTDNLITNRLHPYRYILALATLIHTHACFPPLSTYDLVNAASEATALSKKDYLPFIDMLEMIFPRKSGHSGELVKA